MSGGTTTSTPNGNTERLDNTEQGALAAILREHAETCRDHANALGEILRAWAFVGEGYGCYSNFTVRPEFQKTEPTIREFEILFGRRFDPEGDSSWGDSDAEYLRQIHWFKHPNGIEVGWLWDGDGLLGFHVPEIADDDYDGSLTNGDCKKDDEWRFRERPMKGDRVIAPKDAEQKVGA